MENNSSIHPTAIIEGNIELGNNCTIGPYSYISGNIKLGDNCFLHSHVVINGNVIIGNDCQIFPFSSIGFSAQDKRIMTGDCKVIIGNNCTFREYSTISAGKLNKDKTTYVGNNCYFMISSHIGHDCKIGNSVTLTNGATIGGHCIIDDFSIIGGLSAVHQFVNVGTMCMVGGCTALLKSVPPFSIISDHYIDKDHSFKSGILGINIVGLKRKKYSNKDLTNLIEIFEFLFREDSINVNTNFENLLELPLLDKYRNEPYFKTINDFMRSKHKRGVYRNLINRSKDVILPDDIQIAE